MPPAHGKNSQVMFISLTAQLGGVERVLLACVDAAQAMGCVTDGVLLLTASDGPTVDELRRRGVALKSLALPKAVTRMDSSSRGGYLRMMLRLPFLLPALLLYLFRLRRILARSPARLLHAHGLKAGLLTAIAAPHDRQVIWHVHDFLSLRGRFTIRLLRFTAPRVSLAVAVSDAIARDLAQLLPGLPVATLPNAVGAGFLAEVALPRKQQGRLRVGLLATFGYWKGHSLFLRAAARIHAARPGTMQFLIVGGALHETGSAQTDARDLRKQADALGIAETVEFLPFNPNVRGIYESLDVIVNSSTQPEPFGMTLIEGMSRGCAAVAPDIGGPVEILDEGRAGLLYAPYDDAALAAALAKLLDSPELRNSLAAAGMKRVHKNYAPLTFAHGLAVLYQGLEAPQG